ncbi:MAG TPA: PA14 domain-containing protein, partial [Gemmatimonadales bacterium]|nr:PA14 domain-containing protein [Gemmatimonadales bacterium]
PRSAPASLLTRRDRSAIVVDEWGPYDWRSPKLWPVDSSHAIPLRLRTLGPPGAWRVITRRGITLLSRSAGTMGDTVAVTPARDSAGDWELVLAYTGAATMSPGGIPRRAGTPYRFSYAHYEPVVGWVARALAWSDSSDVRGDSTVFARLLREPPLLVRELARLDFEWYRPQLAELPRERWALEATTTVTLPPGSYNLRTISDDGIRVWVDGVLVIDRWSQHESMLDEAPLRGGRHELRVRYFQLDGWSELRVEILRNGSS